MLIQDATRSTETWVTFAIEAVKIVAPALLALMGSFIALRYQFRSRQAEIDSNVRLKARELMFQDYQNRAERQTEELRKLIRALQNFSTKLDAEDPKEQRAAAESVLEALYGGANPLLFNLERIVVELESFGISDHYSQELTLIKECIGVEVPDITDEKGFREYADKVTKAVSFLDVINQELLDNKRAYLFKEYLPK